MFRPSRRTTGSFLLAATLACGGGSTDATAPGSTVAASLQGTWWTKLNGNSEQVTLTLGAAGSYQLSRATTQESGRINVTGFEILFFESAACGGLGAYRWSTGTGSSLILTLTSDPCATRREALTGGLYRKSS